MNERQFADRDLIPRLLRVIEGFGLDPSRLALEITETIFRGGRDEAQTRLKDLKGLGVSLVVAWLWGSRFSLPPGALDFSHLTAQSFDNAAANFKPDVTGAPKLQADKEQVDLGTIALGQTVDVKFDVTNTGDRPLTFTDVPYVQVVKGCCAPTPEIGARTLQPGQHTTVLVSFMMHEGMGGYHDFRLHLLSNDPGQRDKTVQILSNWQ